MSRNSETPRYSFDETRFRLLALGVLYQAMADAVIGDLWKKVTK